MKRRAAKVSTPRLIPPRQQRSGESLSRILQGAMSLLTQRDLDHISVEDIARASGVAVGNIYRRFSNREALVLELLRRIQLLQLESLEAELAPERWRGQGLAERLDWLVQRQCEAARRIPGLVKSIFASVINRPAEANEESVRLNSQAIEKLTAWLLAASRRQVRKEDACIIVANLLIGVNLALLYPSAFAPHPPQPAVAVLQAAALATLKALPGRAGAA
jgi:AcrR family transcriptional regulator